MLHIFLSVVFVIHAVVFGRIYFMRGRHTHHLMLFLGFILLVIYHGQTGWFEADGLLWQLVHWTGVGLCAAATPALVSSLVRRLRTSLRTGND
jgi:hypothetical protein